jgi:site-specific DNA-methyltransferase (adenine-specific)
MNKLFYGDNLDILQNYIQDESVDLIYLDPPFNSNANYNVLFSQQNGSQSSAQIQAFEDTWQWDETAARTYEMTVERGGSVSEALRAFRRLLGDSNMLAYLVMMAPRLVELHRVLKPTGSLYLHCDPTASHYLKLILDSIFGVEHYLNEIIWQRTAVKGDVKRKFGAVHDVLLLYTKNDDYKFNIIYSNKGEDYLNRFRYDDKDGQGPYQSAPLDSPSPRPNLTYEYKGYPPPSKGWRVSRPIMEELDADNRLIFPSNKKGRIRRKVYLSDQKGPKVPDVWTEISPLQGSSNERLGYPTQKPEELLERIISASSNEGDLVLDPFCGCGTAIAAAQKLNREWIGIDITHLAIGLIKRRMADQFGEELIYEVYGEPTTLEGAQELADMDKYQFEWWALGLVGARPADPKKGADRGIDGRLYFHDDDTGKTKQVIISVKGGHTGVAHIRDLVGVLDREEAQIGVLIALQEPTKPMRTEAASAGFYDSPWGKHPRVQILTIEELLDGAQIDMPPIRQVNQTYRRAPRHKGDEGKQLGLLEE